MVFSVSDRVKQCAWNQIAAYTCQVFKLYDFGQVIINVLKAVFKIHSVINLPKVMQYNTNLYILYYIEAMYRVHGFNIA